MKMRQSTIIDVIGARAREQADQVCLMMLENGDDVSDVWTYGRLWDEIGRVAHALRERNAENERVLLLYPSSLEYIAAFLGTLAAGAVAIPAYPPLSKRVVDRVTKVVDDCNPTLVLSNGSRYAAFSGDRNRSTPLGWIDTTGLPAAACEPADVSPERLAMLQYTSGSTGSPKGVMLTHANLFANCEAIGEWLGPDPERRGCIWLPPYHDMGLLGGILQPLFAGFPLVLLSPLHFLQQPLRWLRAISQHRITLSGAPNFAYELCANAEAETTPLDLSCWKEAFCGAEPVRPKTLDRFAQRFRQEGFRSKSFLPCYGMAEATLLISGRRPDSTSSLVRSYAQRIERSGNRPAAAKTLDLCPNGTAVSGSEVRIVDPESGREVAAGQSGEIWVSGPTIAKGYFGQEELSERTFHARLPGSDLHFLRTGDVGFLDEGELLVTGRLKDLIIIAGKNHHPEDVERTTQDAHPSIFPSGVAVFSIDGSTEEELIVAVEIAQSQSEEVGREVTAAVVDQVTTQHGIAPREVVICRRGALCRTSSGKVQRRATRESYLNGHLGLRSRNAAKASAP